MHLDDTLDTIAGALSAAFPARLGAARALRREAEYPVVRHDGAAGDVRVLVEALSHEPDLVAEYDGATLQAVAGDRVRIGVERGSCTLEITTGPAATLHEIRSLHEAAVRRVVALATAHGMRLLGYGVQPRTPPSEQLLVPTARSLALYCAIGQPWLWFTVTASDQLHVEVGRDELLPVLRSVNALASVVIATCGNSSVYASRDSGWVSVRERGMGAIHDGMARHGMPREEFRSLRDYVNAVAALQWLVREQDGAYIQCEDTFLRHLERHGPDLEAWDQHRRDAWSSGRLRPDEQAVELRAACQQPWPHHMAACALHLGMVEAAADLDRWVVEALGPPAWRILRQYHQDAIAAGLSTAEPLRDFVAGVLARARAALARRGLGEEVYLEPVFERFHARRAPAEDAREVWHRGGLAALCDALEVRPG